MASIIGREWDDDSGVPAVNLRAGHGRGFTEEEQAAIQKALTEGRVTRIERGSFPDSARPDLYPRLAQARETMERRRRHRECNGQASGLPEDAQQRWRSEAEGEENHGSHQEPARRHDALSARHER